ncbi:hypothetical protein F2P81_016745 [Scophthalmus maximus]|uniref:Multidrug and toxin extrusion protein 1-like n=1 Tax=Scophthalmus maximus TaxID=52904 RepID=A0A6A4SGG0_SCOMX|nr:hypothetical protein F2P81_016745 [Scophthalmus maximus]
MGSSARSSRLPRWTECFTSQRIRMLVPVGFKTEIIELSKLAGPVVSIALVNSHNQSITMAILINVTLVSFNSFPFIFDFSHQIICQLMSFAVINVTGISIGYGMSSACDTLISQATFMYSLETTYLRNQGIIWPQVITGFVVNLLNALINYIVLFALNMGVTALQLLIFIYIVCLKYRQTEFSDEVIHCYTGWSKECLQDWGSYIHLAIPGMVMMCVEWWTYEIGGFLAGLISEVELGAQSVVYQLANVAYMFPFGFGVAGNVRVGNALGAGETEQAKLSAKMTMICAGLQPDDATCSQDQTDTMVLGDEEEPLTHRALVLRRGLALAVMLFVLAAGIIMNLLITNLVT